MGSKRKGADAVGDVGDAFRDAYRRTRASRADVLCIWNAAVEQGKRIGVGQARGAVDRGKLPARECYATHWLPSAVDPDNPQPVSIVNLERALQFLVSACPAWDKHLYSALDGEGNLQLLLYNDEVTCGNILAPLKKKKPLAVYCTFRCLWQTLVSVQSWIPVCCVQRTQVDLISDGVSCIMRQAVQALHTEKHETGFVIHFSRGSRKVRLQAPSFFLGDHDAQRSTFGIKGSAGLLPCGFCSNVLNRHTTRHPPGFTTIAEHDLSVCHHKTDAFYADAAEALMEPLSKAALTKKEQSTGLRRMPRGILFSREARLKLPFSSSVTDTMHDYFANGICSTEVAFMVQEMDSQGYRTVCPARRCGDQRLAPLWSRQTPQSRVRSTCLSRQNDGGLHVQRRRQRLLGHFILAALLYGETLDGIRPGKSEDGVIWSSDRRMP